MDVFVAGYVFLVEADSPIDLFSSTQVQKLSGTSDRVAVLRVTVVAELWRSRSDVLHYFMVYPRGAAPVVRTYLPLGAGQV